MITNNHVIDEEIIKENNIINVSLYDEEEIEIIINENNKIYTNKIYDITMIEIKEEKIKNFIELDEIIFKDNPRINNENIYIIQYPADFDDIQKASVSFGIFNEIEDEFNINYLCSTFDGSSGSPILNLKNKKVLGVHKACSNNFNINKGTFLKAPIIEFLNNINIINKKNEINIQLKIENGDINKDVYFLDNTTNEYKFYIDGKDIEHNHDNLKELNQSNVELYIENKKYDFKKFFKPEKEGIYEIQLKFKKNIKDCSFMFYNCNKIINLDFSYFDTRNSKNMSYMFSFCENITNLNLSSFNTKNVSSMSNMFYCCTNITDLNLSSFNTNNVTNMSLMFKGCHSLISLDLSAFDTYNVNNMDNMFSDCNNLTNLNVSSFNTNKITNMNYIFFECEKITSLDLSSFDFNNDSSKYGMLLGCKKLKTVKIKKAMKEIFINQLPNQSIEVIEI